VVAVLKRLGHQVDFPEGQSCCGQMHFDTGHRWQALPMAREFTKAFDGYEAIITPSASSAAMVRAYHPVLATEAGDAGLEGQVAEVGPFGFANVEAPPGTEATADIQVPRRRLGHWDSAPDRRAVEPGRCQLRIGSSIRELPLIATVTISQAQEHWAAEC